jgi:hypothetical protein
MPGLQEVFGISATVPKYTYVDRLGLDATFEYHLKADRHIIVHGGSKQGKTVLRRRHLTEAQSIVISCGPDDTLDSIFQRILANTGAKRTASVTKTRSTGGTVGGEAGASIKLPLIFDGKAKAKTEIRHDASSESVDEYIGAGASLDAVVDAIRKSHRRLVIEDFHYLPEEEQRKLAFVLKAFWDARVFVIVIGIWEEQDLFVFYNNDLSGRVEEIDVRWTDNGLRAVMQKGELALNVHFSSMLANDLIADANANVGLLQRLLEGICKEASVFDYQTQKRTLGSNDLLAKCRARICAAAQRRYFNFANIRGFKNPDKTKLNLYRQVTRACIEQCTDVELLNGIEREALLSKIQAHQPDADLQNLQKALIRINRLQSERKINPPVLSYGEIHLKIILVDRELLFYRKYNQKPWPWQSGYVDDDEDQWEDDGDAAHATAR